MTTTTAGLYIPFYTLEPFTGLAGNSLKHSAKFRWSIACGKLSNCIKYSAIRLRCISGRVKAVGYRCRRDGRWSFGKFQGSRFKSEKSLAIIFWKNRRMVSILAHCLSYSVWTRQHSKTTRLGELLRAAPSRLHIYAPITR
jgi:hypothetical protein